MEKRAQMTIIDVHDILEMPGFTRPIAIRQQHGNTHILCPWCGSKVGVFKTKDAVTFADLFFYAIPLMDEHMLKSPDCSKNKSTATLRMDVKFQIALRRWSEMGIRIIPSNVSFS